MLAAQAHRAARFPRRSRQEACTRVRAEPTPPPRRSGGRPAASTRPACPRQIRRSARRRRRHSPRTVRPAMRRPPRWPPRPRETRLGKRVEPIHAFQPIGRPCGDGLSLPGDKRSARLQDAVPDIPPRCEIDQNLRRHLPRTGSNLDDLTRTDRRKDLLHLACHRAREKGRNFGCGDEVRRRRRRSAGRSGSTRTPERRARFPCTWRTVSPLRGPRPPPGSGRASGRRVLVRDRRARQFESRVASSIPARGPLSSRSRPVIAGHEAVTAIRQFEGPVPSVESFVRQYRSADRERYSRNGMVHR